MLNDGDWVRDWRFGRVWRVRRNRGELAVWSDETGWGGIYQERDFQVISEAEAKEALSNNHGSGFATPPDAKEVQ